MKPNDLILIENFWSFKVIYRQKLHKLLLESYTELHQNNLFEMEKKIT
jgi:hypothetical protein